MSAAPTTESHATECHRQIAANYPQKPEHEFFILSDGSGYIDGFAGAAVIFYSPQHCFCDLSTIAWSGGDTERAEFEGLLAGLQGIMNHCKWDNGDDFQMLRMKRPLVHWLTDRESLALAVARKTDGSTFYRRKSTPDLWARFEWYEAMFRITPHYESRNATPVFRLIDRMASDMREMMQRYAAAWPQDLKWMSGYEKIWKAPELFETHVDAMITALTPIDHIDAERESQMLAILGADVYPIVLQIARKEIANAPIERQHKTNKPLL